MKTIFKTLTGSHLYGLNTEKSDIDYISVYLPDIKDVLGMKKKDQIDYSTNKSNIKNNKNDIDHNAYTLEKYLFLLLKNNPNILETLYSRGNNLITLTPEFEYLYMNKNKIVSKQVYHTFLGYAKSQKNKLITKAERYKSLTFGITKIERIFNEELGNGYIINEKDSEILNRVLKYYKGAKNNVEHFHKGMNLDIIYKLLINEIEKYGWRIKTPEFTTMGFDFKFAYHLIRILGEAKMIFEFGRINYPITGELKEQINSIRNLRMNLKEILELVDYYENEIEKLYKISSLPEKPDFDWFDEWLVETMKDWIVSY